ncbi:PAS domain S-box protein [Rhodopirellula sp. MGV]|uniref:PAS domain S-box protein n=1 Tax=Rhodopirellula sp. MGV TaxID=2023130 RepID=UPI000B97B93B|nr:PAS domain S-box protein [Rhodopirellula sp. MGV]OYP36857.1 hypothetical protein CGZ80_07360 [Rhodopirellula sp. MGV]PNY34053.1 PAS domain S-box protein [Rhodopirellula baltica]
MSEAESSSNLAPDRESPEQLDPTDHSDSRQRPIVVGVGASAGGLSALISMLENLPSDLGMAFVIIQHLDPTHSSSLVDILSRRTSLPVSQVNEETLVDADQVYVIPPGQYLSIEDGCLHLSQPNDARGSRMAIDYFLNSLAEDSCEFGIGIVLSGTGTDGTAGLREIKHYGGLTVVQDPQDAEHTGMPQSAIDTVHIDYVLPANQIGTRLKSYVDFCRQHGPLSAQAASRNEKSDLSPILDLIRRELKHDFRRYRKNTLLRRIRRRMGLLQLEALSDYSNVLADNVNEREALRRDLLIGVTRFFRDPQAWQQLEEHLGGLIDRASRNAPLRVWCAGCATGEEAYSIAMLLLEQTEIRGKEAPFQIFATDVAEDALAIARSGLYPDAIQKDLSTKQLRRFFNKETGGYRISKQLRESVVFASQNVLAQPPFAKLDLILCRNLLIYLEREAQDRVLDVFQFGLKEGGILFLGNTESVGRAGDLFAPISKKLRLFRRTATRSWPPVDTAFESVSPSISKEYDGTSELRRPTRRDSGLAACVQRQVLQQLDRAVAVVNEQGKLLFVEGCADLYLQLNTGELTTELPDLIDVTRRGIKAKLRVGIRQAWKSKQPIDLEGKVQRGGTFKQCQMRISRLLGRPDDPAVLIVFTPQEYVVDQSVLSGEASPESQLEETIVSEQTVMELEHELATTREQLSSSISELESANEELKAANEEAMTMNEELQSSNEELETSKEELQSLNEELTTLNNQLEMKFGELQDSTNDLENFLTSSEVPTVFLDSQFRIRRHTPSCAELFRFIAGDLGRPLVDIATRFTDPDLIEDAEAVLRDLQPRERRVQSLDGLRWYQRRMLPYRTDDDRIQGVVMTFSNITDLLAAQKHAEQQLAQNKNIYSTAPIGLAFVNSDLQFVNINDRLASITGLTVQEHLGRYIADVLPAPFAGTIAEMVQHSIETGRPIHEREVKGQTEGLSLERTFLTSCVPLQQPDGTIMGVNIVFQEVTERKAIEHNLRRSEHRYRTVINATSAITWLCPSSGLFTDPQLSWMRFTGQSVDEHLGVGWQDALHPEDIDEVLEQWRISTATLKPFRSEHRVRRRDGQYRWMNVSAAPIPTERGMVREWFGMAYDVTQRKHTEQELFVLNRRLEVAQRAGGVGSWELQIESKQIQWSDSLFEILGYSPDDFDNHTTEVLKLVHSDDYRHVQNQLDQVIAGKQTRYEVEHRMLHRDGQYIWLRASGVPERDDEGEIVSLCGAAIDITEQKLWESKLSDREAYLRRVLDNQLAFVALMDCEGTTLEVSQSTLDRTGIDRDDAIGVKEWDQPWWNYDDNSRQGIILAHEAVRKGSLIRHDAVIQVAGGTLLEIEYMLSPVYDENSVLRYLIASAVDISDRKRAERNLRRSEKRYRALIDATAEIVWTTNANGKVVEDSPSWREYTGQTYEQWIGWGWLEAIHPDDQQRTSDAWQAAVESQSDCRIEYRVRHHTGEYRWTAVRAVPVRLDDGRIREWVGLNVDIQAQKNAEDLILKSESRLRKAMEIANAGSWEATPSSNEFRVSSLAANLFELDPSAITDLQQILAAIHPEDRGRFQTALAKSVESKNNFSVEVRIPKPDGALRWVVANAEREPDYEPTRLMGFVQDITEQKDASEALRESDRRKDEFLATLAHELRNPLAPLRSGLEILRLAGDDPSLVEDTLETMQRQLAHMVALVDDLMDVSRISKGKLRLRCENLSFQSMIEDAVEISRPMVEESGHHFEIQLPDQDAVLNGDPHRLSQILSNLINNAAKYTPSGGNINLTATLEPNLAVISVSDDGIGIEAKDIRHVFEMFAQIERNESSGNSGLGIGLSLVKSLVDMHGGSISVQSAGLNKGATFTVQLPVVVSVTPLKIATDAVESLGKQDTTPPQKQLKVLVVDDNFAAAKTLSIVIRQLGNLVSIASNGAEGVETAREFQPDLIIMDIGMPVMDGNAAARIIRSEPWGKDIVLVALTGWGQEDDVRKTHDAGFDRHLVKPIEPDVIHRLLNELRIQKDT